MLKFRLVDPSRKKAKQYRSQISMVPFAQMSIFNINSEETVSQTSPMSSRGAIPDFQPHTLAPGSSVCIQHTLSREITEAGDTESRDKEAYKKPDNKSHRFDNPNVSYEHYEKWYTSNKSSGELLKIVVFKGSPVLLIDSR